MPELNLATGHGFQVFEGVKRSWGSGFPVFKGVKKSWGSVGVRYAAVFMEYIENINQGRSSVRVSDHSSFRTGL